MIDLRTERLLPLRDVSTYLKSRGLGERVTVQMVRGWTTRVYGGVRLEAIMVGRWKVTSEEAIQRWVEERTRGSQSVAPRAAVPHPPGGKPAPALALREDDWARAAPVLPRRRERGATTTTDQASGTTR